MPFPLIAKATGARLTEQPFHTFAALLRLILKPLPLSWPQAALPPPSSGKSETPGVRSSDAPSCTDTQLYLPLRLLLQTMRYPPGPHLPFCLSLERGSGALFSSPPISFKRDLSCFLQNYSLLQAPFPLNMPVTHILKSVSFDSVSS